MRDKISITKKINTIRLRGEARELRQFNLIVNDNMFDPDDTSKHAVAIKERIRQRYWKAISRYCLDKHAIAVRLSGLHFDLWEMKEYIFNNDGRNDMVLHYHWWPDPKENAFDEDSFALICCDRRLFKKLFDCYWFSLGAEQRFEGIILKADKIARLEKWTRKKEGRTRDNDLISMSEILFDNLHNGFHYRLYRKIS